MNNEEVELTYEDIEENNKLFQEIINDKNNELAKSNPAFEAQKKAVDEAIKILTDADVFVTMFCEMDFDETRPMSQWNNGTPIMDKRQYSKKERKAYAHSTWWKLAYVVSHSFSHHYQNPRQPAWTNGINAIFQFLKVNYNEWMDNEKLN